MGAGSNIYSYTFHNTYHIEWDGQLEERKGGSRCNPTN